MKDKYFQVNKNDIHLYTVKPGKDKDSALCLLGKILKIVHNKNLFVKYFVSLFL